MAIFGDFPHHSTFSFSPVVKFLPRDAYNWLGNLFFLGWFQSTGIVGMQALRIAIALFSVALIHSLTNFRLNLSLLFVFVVFIYGLHQKLTVRTSLFAVPFFTLLIWIWIHYYELNKPLFLYGFPPLLVLWSNVHGSYLIGFLLLVLLIIGAFLDRLVQSRKLTGIALRFIMILTIILGGIMFVKPFPNTLPLDRAGNAMVQINNIILEQNNFSGSDAFSLTDLRDFLDPGKAVRSDEFALTLDRLQFLFVWITIIFLPIGLLVTFFRKEQYRFAYLLGLVGSTVLSLSFLRAAAYLPLFVLPYLVTLPVFDNSSNQLTRHLVLFTALSTIGGIVLSMSWTGSANRLTGFSSQQIGWGTLDRFSGKLPEHILQNYPKERFFNTYALGGFLIWKWWPYKKVYVDSKSTAYRDSFRRMRVQKSLGTLLDTHALDHALIMRDRSNQVKYFHENESWEFIGMDAGTAAYLRSTD